MGEQPTADEKRMRLRYAGTCRSCGIGLPAGSEAVYERMTKTVRCRTHEPEASARPRSEPAPEPAAVPEPSPEATNESAAPDAGTPGGSARREFERRRRARQDRVRTQHPKLGGFLLAVTDDPQSTRAWDVGALGEERLGGRLTELAGDALRVLHDRRIPGSRANIDHVAVTPTGIWVIDAKQYKGQRPQLRVEGGIIRARTEKLLVGSRDCTKLVDGMLKQVRVVEAALDVDVPVHGVLCFVEADWPLIGGAFRTRGVEVLWPKKLYAKLREPGPIEPAHIDALHQRLATALPPA